MSMYAIKTDLPLSKVRELLGDKTTVFDVYAANTTTVVDPERQIAAVWDISDVQSLADVTDAEAMNVLANVAKNQDNEVGISWSTIEYWLNELYPEAKPAEYNS